MHDVDFTFALVIIQNATANLNNPNNITAEEYFDPEVDLKGRDIGRPKEISKKVQSFKVPYAHRIYLVQMIKKLPFIFS